MRFIRPNAAIPLSSGVIHSGDVLEAVLTGIPYGESRPVRGGAAIEMFEIFRQLDQMLFKEGLNKGHVCSVRIYLQYLHEDIDSINWAWRNYFGKHPPNRRCYGVDLQSSMRVEAAFVVEVA